MTEVPDNEQYHELPLPPTPLLVMILMALLVMLLMPGSRDAPARHHDAAAPARDAQAAHGLVTRSASTRGPRRSQRHDHIQTSTQNAWGRAGVSDACAVVPPDLAGTCCGGG